MKMDVEEKVNDVSNGRGRAANRVVPVEQQRVELRRRITNGGALQPIRGYRQPNQKCSSGDNSNDMLG